MKILLRLLGNFVIVGFLILIFDRLNWIDIIGGSRFVDSVEVNKVVVGGIIGCAMLFVGEILEILYKASKIATLGFSKILYPFYVLLHGLVVFFVPMYTLLSGWYVLGSEWNFLYIFLMVFLIGVVRVPK